MNDASVWQDEGLEALVAQVVDEFRAEQRAGAEPDIEEYAARYPHAASLLRKVLASWRLIGLSAGGAANPAEEVVTGILGDYRLLREVGRGGMGVVYEAQQISLGRSVALKVLPFAATMDPRHLQRFHNEARSAASLHHPHIVPVYAVGCERAVHFYAMQFIDGNSLADMIAAKNEANATPSAQTASPGAETRTCAATPTQGAPSDPHCFRRAADWGIQAAEALEYAHSLGIVHRDVKPGNLMVDGQGKLWVTDFGLARSATDAGLTMTGDVLGTLRYMSPEQALAKHGLVDHRTDVYSLGATLYELVTGRPAIDGQDRQIILSRIADEEPRPPRAIDPAVPPELETIVLKALAKDPAERYSTSMELAEDLRRFLDNRPIQAKRPTLPSRLRKWAQRKRHLVQTTCVFLAVLVVGLAVGAFLLWCEKQETDSALAQAKTNYARAESQRRRAETNFREAFWAIEDLLNPYDRDRRFRPLTVDDLRQWQTKKALHFLAKFCEEPSDDPAVRLQIGVAYVHTGRVHQVLGDHRKAQGAFRQASAVFARLVQEFPTEPAYPRELGSAVHILAEDLYLAGNFPEANASYSQAMGVFRNAFRDHPGDAENARSLARSLCLWFDPSTRDPKGALEPAQRAVELAPGIPESWNVLGIAYYRTGQWDAAASALQKASQESTHDRKFNRTVGAYFLAMAHWRLGRREEAMQEYLKAQRHVEDSFNPRDALDRAIHAEAAALLRIDNPLTPKATEPSGR